MKKIIDLRSDTVTQPTPAMRTAMASAEVGDDVYNEDPTVNHLQEMAADMLGKEAGLFVASGTMGNLTAILAHCQRGDEVILGRQAHIFLAEAGGISALGGVHSCQIPNQPDGSLDLDDIRQAIREDDPHDPVSRVIALENTHNRCGGVPLTVEYTAAVGELAHEHHLRLHLDGARLFNASIAQGVSPRRLAEPADSVTICLSKGLSAPVGSVVCGSRDFIARAYRVRKVLGGAMRQVGVLAAAGIVALESMVDRLAEDHALASRLAHEIVELPGISLLFGLPKTNMIFVELADGSAEALAIRLAEQGVLVGVYSSTLLRLVTHYGIEESDIDAAANAISEAVMSLQMIN